MTPVCLPGSQGIATRGHDDRGTTAITGSPTVTRTATAETPKREPRAANPATEPLATFEGRVLPDQTEPAWDQGLEFDVETLVGRRSVLRGIGLGMLGVGLAAC